MRSALWLGWQVFGQRLIKLESAGRTSESRFWRDDNYIIHIDWQHELARWFMCIMSTQAPCCRQLSTVPTLSLSSHSVVTWLVGDWWNIFFLCKLLDNWLALCQVDVIISWERPGHYLIKVTIILSLQFEINFVFYFVQKCKKNTFVNFFLEIVY